MVVVLEWGGGVSLTTKKTKFVLGPQIDEYLEMGGVSLQKILVPGRGPQWLSLPFFLVIIRFSLVVFVFVLLFFLSVCFFCVFMFHFYSYFHLENLHHKFFLAPKSNPTIVNLCETGMTFCLLN